MSTPKPDESVIAGTYCPFGVSAVAAPMETLRGTQIGIMQSSPQCTKRCMFYNQAYDVAGATGSAQPCTIRSGIDKLLSLVVAAG